MAGCKHETACMTTTLNLDELASRWETAMRAAGRSPNTIKSHLTAVRLLKRWQDENGRTGFSVAAVSGFTGSVIEGSSRSTAATRAIALKSFASWLKSEGITRRNVLSGFRIPDPGEQAVQVLTSRDLGKLVLACTAGSGFTAVRDEALVLFLACTGARSNEALLADITDLDMTPGEESCLIRNGKGNHQRRVALTGSSLPAMRRYLDMRASMRPARNAVPYTADSGPLWLSAHGSRLSWDGASASIKRRAAAAGVMPRTRPGGAATTGFHLHLLRSEFAVQWRLRGGSDAGLKTAGGWRSDEMPAHYTRAAAGRLALDESRRVFA